MPCVQSQSHGGAGGPMAALYVWSSREGSVLQSEVGQGCTQTQCVETEKNRGMNLGGEGSTNSVSPGTACCGVECGTV